MNFVHAYHDRRLLIISISIDIVRLLAKRSSASKEFYREVHHANY